MENETMVTTPLIADVEKRWKMIAALLLLVGVIIGGIMSYLFLSTPRLADEARELGELPYMGSRDDSRNTGEISDSLEGMDDTTRETSDDDVSLGDDSMSSGSELSGYEGITFPIVVYSRAGLWSDLMASASEREKIEELLVAPMRDYYNEQEVNLVSLQITVPAVMEDPYEVTAIFANPSSISEFLFGNKEGEYSYWEPDCIDECDFSPSFSERYPVIVNREE